MRKVFKMFLPRNEMELLLLKRQNDLDLKLMKIKANQENAKREERMRDHFRKIGVN
ncbi:hypothetical protein [Bacillus thuringiensis]|uniref:hypothetical protein n=1 Tax=Bacillus thuringiensis TaxID=1428 RepID=UPI0015970A18|nr:hypothetical protein [Bacillus thuringiensis]